MPKPLVLAFIIMGAFLLGVGSATLASQAYWQGVLNVELAEKDRLVARLDQDVVELRTRLENLDHLHQALRQTIEASLRDSTEVARSNKASVEKLRGLILRLEQLQGALQGL